MSATPLRRIAADTTYLPGVFPEDPPQAATGRSNPRYEAIADLLRANPGQWFRIDAMSRKDKERGWRFASGINQGKYIALRDDAAGRFEANARTVGMQVLIHARYVPVTPKARRRGAR